MHSHVRRERDNWARFSNPSRVNYTHEPTQDDQLSSDVLTVSAHNVLTF